MFVTFLEENSLAALLALLAVAAVALLGLYALRLRRYRLIKKYASWQREAEAVETATHESLAAVAARESVFVSVVVPANERSADLRRLVDALLSQKCARRFEVILADENSCDEVRDVYKLCGKNRGELRYTFVPPTSRYIERRKLAVTLGVKAARGEWVIVVSPDTLPQGDNWLHAYAQNLTDDLLFAQTYCNYADTGRRFVRRAILDRACRFVTAVSEWERGRVATCGSSGWAVRRQWFLDQNGFADSLSLTFGEEALFAARHVEAERCLFLCSPETSLRELGATPAGVELDAVWRAETACHIGPLARKPRRAEALVSALSYVFAISVAIYICLRVALCVGSGEYRPETPLVDIPLLLLAAAGVTVPLVCAKSAMQTLGERAPGAGLIVRPFAWPLRTLRVWIDRMGHRDDFARKYI